MGLLDIFYGEMNRVRDKANSDEEKKRVVKEALKKSLKKFEFVFNDWMLSEALEAKKINPQLGIFSEEFMDLAVEVDDILENSEITENLREISKALMVVSRKDVTMGGYFDNPIPTEVGQSLARIEKIKSKLE